MSWALRTIALNETEWTPLYPTFDCDYFVVRNIGATRWAGLFGGVTVLLRTDKDDEATEIDLPVNAQDGVTVPFSCSQTLARTRFYKTTPACWAKSSDGNTEVTTVSIT